MTLEHLVEEALIPGKPSGSAGGFDDSRRRRCLLWLLYDQLSSRDWHQVLAHFYYFVPPRGNDK